MEFVKLRASLAALVFVLALPAASAVAQRPTPQQAEQLLRTRPDLVALLRQRIAASGMTREQIHARLKAEGYPENILDPYLPGTSTTTEPSGSTRDTVIVAAQRLGITESSELEAFGYVCETPASDTTAAAAAADSTPGTRRARVCRPRDAAGMGATQRSDSGFVIFGLDIFRGATTQFDPNSSGPVDPSYRVGPGDQMALIMTGDVEQTLSLSVSREGYVLLPTVGQVYVANLTMSEVQALFRSRLARSYSGIDAGTLRFTLSITGLRSAQVFVLGDVVRPGSYRLSSLGTALSGLYAAGGPSANGSLRSVVVRRGGRVVDTLDVYDYLLRGDATHDPNVQNGDVIFVPVHGPRVRIAGEVIRPATYELKPGETLAQLIATAGGFTESASRRRVQIERILPPSQRSGAGRDRVVLDVASHEFTTGTGPALPLQPGDVVRVFGITERIRNRIVVRGNVWQPGTQGFTPGMTLSQALKAAGGPKPDVYLPRVLITRVNSDSTRVQMRAALRDTLGTPVDDVPLREDDEIEVFGIGDFRAERYVSISGAVRSGGRFKYREGMTLRDLTLLAGGLVDGAYVKEAEIARVPETANDLQTAVTIRVPLDSSYLLAEQSGAVATAPDVPLKELDNVLILREPNFIVPRSVVVTGEVKFPGRYTLASRHERLLEVIRRAGGPTREAYPEGVVFYRKQDKIGRIGIDLPRVLKRPSHRDNLILMDGDSIHLPQYRATVLVTGAVNAPVAVAYVPGQPIDYYIGAAGGATRLGDPHRAYVMQPNGKVESTRNIPILPDLKPRPGGGSTVYVPNKDPNDAINYVQMISSIASIIGTAITTYVLIRNVR